MAATAGIISAIAAAASAGTGIAGAAGAFDKGGGSQPKLPTMPTTDTTQLAKGLLPGAKADTAARTGGGVAPDFLANIIGQQTGEPGAGLDIIGEIRKSLGQ